MDRSAEASAALQAAIARGSDEALERPFDVVVAGAGAAGGLAALLLAEAGLQVLVLDAGWQGPFWRTPVRRMTAGAVRAVANPRLQTMLPPRVTTLGRKALRLAGKARQPVQTRCFAWEMAPGAFVDDRDNPYLNAPGTRFDWFRVHQVGGRMTIPGHGRQYYRMAPGDFAPTDGLSPPWPLDAGELDPWYEAVERRLGLSGGSDHSPWVPDAVLAHRLRPSAAEAEAMDRITSRWPGVAPILGRSAPPLDALGQAARTGRVALRQGAHVRDALVARGRVQGVRWFDQQAGRMMTASAPIVFLCASALETTRILLTSRTEEGQALGAQSDALGRFLMDHVVVSGEGVGGSLPDEPVASEPGRCVYLPRFDRRTGKDAGRGYGAQIYRWSLGRGRSYFNAVTFAEMTPRAQNRVELAEGRRDARGFPILRISCTHSAAETALAADQAEALEALGAALSIRFHRLDDRPAPPGTAIHECGSARMGARPESSVVDPGNECWDARGLFVTDAAAFPSQGAQNPTLTILALTARACARATGGGGKAAAAGMQAAAEAAHLP